MLVHFAYQLNDIMHSWYDLFTKVHAHAHVRILTHHGKSCHKLNLVIPDVIRNKI